MLFKTIVQILGTVAIICAFIPMLGLDIWWINIFDYPLIEFSIMSLTLLIFYFFVFNKNFLLDYGFITILFILLIAQVVKIFPYTPLGEKEMGDSSEHAQATIKIFECNVLQENNKNEKLLKQINAYDPDILLFTETSERWQKSIDSGIGSSYRYKVQVPQENTYGMLLYSKFELVNSNVNYRVQGKIPSIHTQLVLPDGTTVLLYAIHPTPPDPEHKSSSSDRGIEMIKTALTLVDEDKPIIVLGDFNEVAWSKNVSLFQEISGLLDVRKGRGFYNTFNANLFFMRWPLDQLFASEQFRASDLKKWGYMGSDHYPFSVTLTYEPLNTADQKPHPISKEVLKLLEKKVADEESKRKKENFELL